MAGRMITDRASFMGNGSKVSEGVKTKTIPSVSGAGAMMNYPDTAEAVHSDQVASVGKIKGNGIKEGYRN